MPPKKSDSSAPRKRRTAELIHQRGRLMLEISALERSGRASQFIANAEELLTRWWGTASWNARHELLKSATWMLQLESNRPPTNAMEVVRLARERCAMAYLIAGALVSLATVSGLWACLPGADGLAKPALVKNGIDAWVAIAITCGFALGVGGLIAGAAEAFGLLK